MNIRNRNIFIMIALAILLCILIVKLVFFSPLTAPKTGPGVTAPKTKQTVTYDENDQRKLVNKFENRQALENNDQLTREKLLKKLPATEQSGTIFQASDYKVDYVHSANLFQVEIQATDIEKTKREANQWFLDQGMSQNGICNLPVQFYLSFDIMSQLQGQHITVSPLAPGC